MKSISYFLFPNLNLMKNFKMFGFTVLGFFNVSLWWSSDGGRGEVGWMMERSLGSAVGSLAGADGVGGQS